MSFYIQPNPMDRRTWDEESRREVKEEIAKLDPQDPFYSSKVQSIIKYGKP